MTRITILGAAAVLSMMVATPAFAQAALQEPGAFAFYHPNTNVLNARAALPYGRSHAYLANRHVARAAQPGKR
ncbi:hypothetical protein ES703_20931 [subsurface metagenome]